MSRKFISPVVSAKASGSTPATATISAPGVGKQYFCTYVTVRSDAAGSLEILDGSTSVFDVNISADTTYHFPFPQNGGPQGSPNTAMSAKVTAAGASAIKLNIGAEKV